MEEMKIKTKQQFADWLRSLPVSGSRLTINYTLNYMVSATQLSKPTLCGVIREMQEEEVMTLVETKVITKQDGKYISKSNNVYDVNLEHLNELYPSEYGGYVRLTKRELVDARLNALLLLLAQCGGTLDVDSRRRFCDTWKIKPRTLRADIASLEKEGCISRRVEGKNTKSQGFEIHSMLHICNTPAYDLHSEAIEKNHGIVYTPTSIYVPSPITEAKKRVINAEPDLFKRCNMEFSYKLDSIDNNKYRGLYVNPQLTGYKLRQRINEIDSLMHRLEE